jgi:polysaccharide biosynthesis transport protein
MGKDLSPYSIRRERQPRKAQLTVLAEDLESNVRDDLQQYWRIVRKHLGLVLAVCAVFFVLALLHDMMLTPLYSASSTLLIRNSAPPLLENATVTIISENTDTDSGEQDQTQIQLLKSRTLAIRVIRDEGLTSDPGVLLGTQRVGLMSMLRHEAKSLLHGFRDSSSGSDARPKTITVGALTASYLSRLEITPIPNTQMVRISFTSADPKLSARLANAHAREFINWEIEMNSRQSEEAEHFLEGKLAQIKQQLEFSEAAVNSYRRDKGIVPGLISVNGSQDVVLERLNKTSENLEAAHLRTISLGTQVSMVKEGRTDALPEVMQSSLVQRLKEQLDSDEAEYATLAGKFKPDFPPLKQLALKIKSTRDVLDHEISNAVASVQAQYLEAAQRESTLQADLNQQKTYAFGLNDSAVRYLILEREADTNRELYNAVLKRIKDLTVVADVHASNISVVDGAEPNASPSSPQTFRDVAAAGVLGLAAGLGLAFLIDLLDNTLKDSREVERYLRIPNLALIPEAPKDRDSLYPAAQLTNGEPTNGTRYNAVVSYNGRYSVLGEAYRNLRTGLMLSRAGAQPRITLISSAIPNEGKTTVSVNTAVVLAHAGGRVLLIDADLRMPRCHKVLRMANLRGLTEVLTGQAAPEESIRPTSVDNLFFMTSGQTPPNPSELLSSPQMKQMLKDVAQDFDHVILDSPPALPVSDPVILSTLVDGVVLVAAGSRTPKQQVKAALARLRHAHAKIFGIVLNKIKLQKLDYFFPYYKYGYYGPSSADEVETQSEAVSPPAV